MSTPKNLRLMCRNEIFSTHTSGILPGYMQANLLILPEEVAMDFKSLCKRNPVPCPLLSITIGPCELDNKVIKSSEIGFDIRTDLPKYHIFNGGKLQRETNNCKKEWTSGHVGFLIGCSYSFEGALINSGLVPKNILYGKNVSMYKTTKLMNPAGVFAHCPYVVSMRPYKEKFLDKVRDITAQYQLTHGEPVDWGYDGAARLGINNLDSPDYGDSITIEDDEIPVFWGCGVTPQLAIETMGDLIDGTVITHAPGHMLVLDVTYEEFSRSFS